MRAHFFMYSYGNLGKHSKVKKKRKTSLSISIIQTTAAYILMYFLQTFFLEPLPLTLPQK